MDFNPQKILIIDFGQIGDVILSLPALRVIREKFPNAEITVMVGKAGIGVIEMIEYADEKIVVDRAELRRSNKFWSIWQIVKLVADVRRRKFDFVIDLHSFYETNLLGFLSGAKDRLFANRENRSLDFLSNFQPKPPLENKKKHWTEYYLSVLEPLGIENIERFSRRDEQRRSDLETVENLLENLSAIVPLGHGGGDNQRFYQMPAPAADLETVENLLQAQSKEKHNFIGLFPGGGHPGRRWELKKFVQLAELLTRAGNFQIVVFLGPEEKNLRVEIERKFPAETIIFDKLTLSQFAAALSRMQILISNDTGAVHIGAVVGTSIVLISQNHAPITFLPLTERLSIVRSGKIDQITVEEVFRATQKFLNSQDAVHHDVNKNHQSQTK